MGLDLQDDKTLRRLLLVALVIVCVLVAAVVGLLTRKDEEKSPERLPPVADLPSTSATPDRPKETKAPSNQPPKAAEALAKKAVKAYTEYSYKDPGPLAWLDRLGPYATGDLRHELRETFEKDQQADWAWNQDIVPNKEQSRTTIVGVDLDKTFSRVSATKATYLVAYMKSVNRSDTDGWTTPQSPLSLAVTVEKRGGSWKVSQIKPPQPTG